MLFDEAKKTIPKTRTVEPQAHQWETNHIAEVVRETCLKCIAFNGIPRTINVLKGFVKQAKIDCGKRLAERPSNRQTTARNIKAKHDLDQSYGPAYTILSRRSSRKALLTVILICRSSSTTIYSVLLANPPQKTTWPAPPLGRVLTSVAAIAALRAQTGASQQVISHVRGLQQAYSSTPRRLEQGNLTAGPLLSEEDDIEGGEWLASDQGCIWLLSWVDQICFAFRDDQGHTAEEDVKECRPQRASRNDLL
ncbi:hypothetical protein MRB53_040110 [Persea americana]|nr:hypothetical protein MRB53_040110 [Persea americana]